MGWVLFSSSQTRKVIIPSDSVLIPKPELIVQNYEKERIPQISRLVLKEAMQRKNSTNAYRIPNDTKDQLAAFFRSAKW